MSDEAKKEHGPSASLSKSWVKAAKRNTHKKRRSAGRKVVDRALREYRVAA